MEINDKVERSIESFLEELDKIEKTTSYDSHQALEKSRLSDISLRIHQSEWHVRGVTYHCRNLIKYYTSVSLGVIERVKTTKAGIIMMNDESVQKLMFEFYALVNLARISLDNLRNLLEPVFLTPYEQLPKHITDFKTDSTDCPVYTKIADDPAVIYLIDIRNCLVHYRTFATDDNVMVVMDGIEPNVFEEFEWTRSMARASFRRTENDRIIFNMYLPDEIFQRNSSGNKKLAKFTYEMRINIISQSMEFVRILAYATLGSLKLLIDHGTPKYTYRSKSTKI